MNEITAMNTDEIKLIKTKIRKQLIVPIICLLVIIGITILISEDKTGFSNQIRNLFLSFGLIPISQIIINNRKEFKDISHGEKEIVQSMVTEKKEVEKMGATITNNYKPQIEFRIKTNNDEVIVDSNLYNILQKGDKIDIHYSLYSRKLLKVAPTIAKN